MKSYLIIALLLCFAGTASAQYEKGDFEMMLLGTAGSMTETNKVTINSPVAYEISSDETNSYAYLSLTPAYYIIDKLAAELELGLRAMEGGKPTQTFIFHLAYTQPLVGSSLALFARAGYGLSNGYSVPIFYEQVRSSNDFDIGIVNLGAGAKIMAGRHALIRAEINYRMQSASEDSAFGTSEWTRSTIAILLGVGIIL